MSETREKAAMRAYEAYTLAVYERLEVGAFEDKIPEMREVWCKVADAVRATIEWDVDEAVVGRLDDMEERLRKLEKSVEKLEES